MRKFFEVDNSSSAHVDNIKKDILVLTEGLVQGLDYTVITTQAKYPINFTIQGRRFVLSLNYDGSNNFLLVNAVKKYEFQSKDSKI